MTASRPELWAAALALACGAPRPATPGPAVREWADPNYGRVLMHLPAEGTPPSGLVIALGVAHVSVGVALPTTRETVRVAVL